MKEFLTGFFGKKTLFCWLDCPQAAEFFSLKRPEASWFRLPVYHCAWEAFCQS